MANEIKLESVSVPVFGISSRRYRQLAKDEVVPPVLKGEIDFVKASKALIDYYRKLAEGQGSLSLTDMRTENVRLRNDLLRMEMLIKKGELVQKADILSLFLTRVQIVRQGLLTFHRSLPPMLANKEAREIADILKRHVLQLLEQFSRKGGILRA